MGHYLIIVARHRPDLLQQFDACEGDEIKVILDRRREPLRTLLLAEIRQRAQMTRDGFVVVRAGRAVRERARE
jgi:hypothetical protein